MLIEEIKTSRLDKSEFDMKLMRSLISRMLIFNSDNDDGDACEDVAFSRVTILPSLDKMIMTMMMMVYACLL